MKKDYKRFFVLISLAALPIIIIIIIYIIKDPFRVIYDYPMFYKNDVSDNLINRDYASTEIMLENYKQENYDTYVFGSSRSLSFRCSEIRKYIKCNCFHYDASAESLQGILVKLKLIDKLNLQINNCIIVLDSGLVYQAFESDDHLLIKHPLISESSNLAFQYKFLQTFLSNKFFIPYLFTLVKMETPLFLNYSYFFDQRLFVYDNITNDISMPSADLEIFNDTLAYYKKLGVNFISGYDSDSVYYNKMLNNKKIEILQGIKYYFEKHKTNYIVIIYPEYNKMKFQTADINILNNIFGVDNIYNYSGKNKYTQHYTNYYDWSHLRWYSGNEILKEIFHE